MSDSIETSEDMAQPNMGAVPGDSAAACPIERAVQLLREGAAEIAQSVSISDIPDWANEPDSKAAHDEALMVARHLESLAPFMLQAHRERQIGEAVAWEPLRKPLQLAAEALQDLIAAGQMAKECLDSDIPTGEPVHPVSRRLTWPLSTALLAEKEARHALASLPAPQAALTEDEITLLLADKIGFGDSDLQTVNRGDLVSIIRAVEASKAEQHFEEQPDGTVTPVDPADRGFKAEQAEAPKANMFHDAGAIAQCQYCKRYTLDSKALSDRQPVCACGKQHGWSGSFKPPGPEAQWHGAAPGATQPTASNAGEVEAFESEYKADARDPGMAEELRHFTAGFRAALATKPPAGEQKPVEWGSPTTVEKLIRQLQTFNPATPITSAVHTDYKGKRVALTNPLTMSRERVEGRFIRQGDASVPYSLVIWAQPDELGAQSEQVAQHVYASPIFTLAIDALNKTKAWRDCDGNDGFPHDVREQIDAVLMAYELRAARARGEKGGA